LIYGSWDTESIWNDEEMIMIRRVREAVGGEEEASIPIAHGRGTMSAFEVSQVMTPSIAMAYGHGWFHHGVSQNNILIIVLHFLTVMFQLLLFLLLVVDVTFMIMSPFGSGTNYRG
jgi:hypothetical protein